MLRYSDHAHSDRHHACFAANALGEGHMVARNARHHWHVAKTEQKGTVVTRITPLTETTARREEIARMLSGANITTEARAQADRLLENALPATDQNAPAA